MTNRLVLFAKATLAALVLAAVTVGVPAALAVTVGWPLPRTLPAPGRVVDAIRYEGIAPGTVVKALATAVWVAWALTAWAVVVEAAAALRGRLARRPPIVGGIQRNVARLVAVVTLAAAALTAPRPPAAPPAAPALHTLLATPDDTLWTPISYASDTKPAATEPSGRWCVERHDTYWGIADATLGDGHAWQRIRDLNIGRTMPDGTTITADSELLRPGWELLLPNDATPPQPTTGVSAVVAPGDSLWSIAEDHLTRSLGRPATRSEITTYWAELVALNATNSTDADLIHPGQHLTLPATPATAQPEVAAASPQTTPADAPAIPEAPPAETAAPPALPSAPRNSPPAAETPTPPAPAQAPTTGTDPRDGHNDEQADTAGTSRPLGLAGASLAAGALVAYRRRRTIATSRLAAGCDLPAPAGFDDLRAELAFAGDLDQPERIDAALVDIARCGATAAAVTVARDHLVVQPAERGHQPPIGWEPGPQPDTWVLGPDSTIAASGDRCPAPLLVAVGRSDTGDVHLNLEALGMTSIVGDHPDAVDALVRSITAELTTAPDRHAAVITVGRVGDLVAGDAPRRAFNWDEVADDVVALAHQTAAAVETAGSPSPACARSTGDDDADDALAATLLVLEAEPDDPRYRELLDVINTGRAAMAVLVAGPAAPATVISLTGTTITIPSLGITATAQQVSADTAERLEDLLAAAEEIPTDPPMLDFGDATDPPAAATSGADIIVRVLGPVRIEGAFKALTPKQAAVVAYIALHAPVTGDRIEDAVWATATSSRRKRLANTLWECRVALGANTLPVADGGLYRTGPGVTTDTALFDHHVRASATAATGVDDVAAQRAELRFALELVDGPVFRTRNAHRASYVWVDLENWVATWELKIATVALRLIALAAADGDFDEAVWAAETGLRALPTHAELTEALMNTYAERGDLAAAAAVYTSHVAALEDLDLDDVAPSTQELWEQLRLRQSA